MLSHQQSTVPLLEKELAGQGVDIHLRGTESPVEPLWQVVMVSFKPKICSIYRRISTDERSLEVLDSEIV